jgi:hypothetical protein
MPDSRSRKGYHRGRFEAAWRAYYQLDDVRMPPDLRVIHSA